jgi:signal transduction histidine kinase
MALEVAHEIRNPLTVIGGYAISQSKRLEPGDRSYRVLEIISRQVSRIEEALDRFSSVVTLSEKMEGDFPLAHLLKETLCMLSGGANSELPLLQAGENEREIQVFIDPGLFHQAMIAILRKASQISGGFQNLILRVASNGPAARIFLSGTDNCANFAENFYRLFRESKGDLSNQDMAVALEILQHYGGGVGVMSDGGSGLRVYIELPLHGEER